MSVATSCWTSVARTVYAASQHCTSVSRTALVRSISGGAAGSIGRHLSSNNRYLFAGGHRSGFQRTARSYSASPQILGSLLPTTMLGFAAGTIAYNVALSGLVALGTNVAGFLVAMVTKTHKITDLVGCGTFAVAAWATHVATCQANGLSVFAPNKPLFLTIGVTFWSVRLAGFLFYRILQTGNDKRLEPFYNKEGEPWFTGPSKYPLKLLFFWSLQATWAWVVLLPVTVAQAAVPAAAMGPWAWAGFGAYMFFFAYEAGADFQKDWFKRQPGNKDEFVRTGFFYFCQYPNYFAEISVWWTMFCWAGFPSVAASNPWIIVSPLFTTWLLIAVSGVKNLRYYQQQRYGDREDYREYVAKTPVLLPFMKPFYSNREPEPAPLLPGTASDSAGDATNGTE